ncbi:MAG: uroporphyrinogen decarboxylase family protein [Phycisphaerae bacterium]|jgi:uroporphyrinogen decarboxylase
MISDRERFIACMDYQTCDRRPNHELGVWAQTAERWRSEAPQAIEGFNWDWFSGETALRMDRREFISVHYRFDPTFEHKVLEETERYETYQDELGIVRKALKEGSLGAARPCMDEYLSHPVKDINDFREIKKRLIAATPSRYPADLAEKVKVWRTRDYPLVLGTNCNANGFYWRARELMGTENLSYAWYDQPEMMHEIMEFMADFFIENSRPVLDQIDVEYFTFNEDMAMKSGPLLGPETFKTFIFPHLKRVVEFMRSKGVRYVVVDSDGNPTALIPLLLEAGVDTLWPVERASDFSPLTVRKQFGKSLRLWGGVDKRVLARGPAAIREHLRELIPLIEEGGFIPTVDHLVPPDVSWDNFRYYMDCKWDLLAGRFEKLG